jgi:hypothetical protein
MKLLLCLLCLLGGSVAWGQIHSGPNPVSGAARADDAQKTSRATSSEAPAPAIAMNAPVITIKGFCPEQKGGTTRSASCETVITREQFETMVAAVRANVTMSVKQQLAKMVPRLMVMSHAAEEMGIDQQSPYKEMIAFSRMQILAQGLNRKVQVNSANISDQELANYYQKNVEMFDEYILDRLVVPLRKALPDGQRDYGREQDAAAKAEERELTELAEKLRARAAAGEEMLKLQKEAFDAAGAKVASPTTSMDKVRRTALPDQPAIFELKVGEVSQVVTDGGGHYIYKLDGKDRVPLEEVKGEIRKTLQNQRAAEVMDKIQNSYTTDLNEGYFAVPPAK